MQLLNRTVIPVEDPQYYSRLLILNRKTYFCYNIPSDGSFDNARRFAGRHFLCLLKFQFPKFFQSLYGTEFRPAILCCVVSEERFG